MAKTGNRAPRSFQVRRIDDTGFWWASNTIIDVYARQIGPIALGVYCSLCRHADNNDSSSFPSYEKIAKELGISRRTVIRGMKILLQTGLVRVEIQGHGGGSNIYWLCEPQSQGVTPESPLKKRSDTGVTPRSDTGVTPRSDTGVTRTRPNELDPMNKTHTHTGAGNEKTTVEDTGKAVCVSLDQDLNQDQEQNQDLIDQLARYTGAKNARALVQDELVFSRLWGEYLSAHPEGPPNVKNVGAYVANAIRKGFPPPKEQEGDQPPGQPPTRDLSPWARVSMTREEFLKLGPWAEDQCQKWDTAQAQLYGEDRDPAEFRSAEREKQGGRCRPTQIRVADDNCVVEEEVAEPAPV